VRSPATFSPQTLLVLAALLEEPSHWRHGYALASETGLKSGTLYPILIRLAERGLVEACWQQEPAPGRPRRHLYRLTAPGLASATEARASAAGSAARPGARAARPARAGRPAVNPVTG
jgi:PadR family transcriptional regulator, regulatory protein PadR